MENNLILLIILVVALSQVALVVYYVLLHRDLKTKDQGFEDQGLDTLHDAIKKSQAIVGNAELESIKQIADSRLQTEKMEKKYENEMEMSVDEVLLAIKNETAKAGEAYKTHLNEQTEAFKHLTETEIKEALMQMRGQLEKNMFEIQDGFSKELASYKSEKEKQIDQNAEEIIEQAVELYLKKKLGKEQHMQLVFESLEQAKVEKKLL